VQKKLFSVYINRKDKMNCDRHYDGKSFSKVNHPQYYAILNKNDIDKEYFDDILLKPNVILPNLN
jgi:hypothetical protein